jgi:hypothetical protein
MSRLAWLANPQYLRYVVNKRIVVTAAIRARAGINAVLRLPDCAPLRCANASPAQHDYLVRKRMN